MKRYKLARIVDGRFLSANQGETWPVGERCLEYRVGEIVSASNKGIACYKRKEDALKEHHIKETRDSFNSGNPIALLTLKPIGRVVYKAENYGKGMVYEGGVNYRSVEVLKAVQL